MGIKESIMKLGSRFKDKTTSSIRRFEIHKGNELFVYYDCNPIGSLEDYFRGHSGYTRTEKEYGTSWEKTVNEGDESCAIVIGLGKPESSAPGRVNIGINGNSHAFVEKHASEILSTLPVDIVPMNLKRVRYLERKFLQVASKNH